MDTVINPNESADAKTLISEESFSQRLGSLTESWQADRNSGLVLRFDTGRLINDHVGAPNGKRQKRGQEVLQRVAEKLEITLSEISRMRWFADCFNSSLDFKQKHPEVTTWAAVKDLLPKLRQSAKADGQKSGNGASQQAKRGKRKLTRAKKLGQGLTALSTSLKKAGNVFSDDEKSKFLKQFKEFAEAVGDCLKIRVSIEEASEEPAPPSAPESQAA